MNTRTRQKLIAAAVASAISVPAGAAVAVAAQDGGHSRMQSSSTMRFGNRMDADDLGGGMMSGSGSGQRSAAGQGAGLGRANMGSGQGMGASPGMAGMYVSDEFGYLAEMIPHHEEAIAAARQLLAHTDRSEMKNFARTIIATQGAEVARMRAYLNQWYPGKDTTADYTPMMRDLGGLSGDALDRAFLEDMIPHHHMAVMMSQQILNRALAKHSEVSALATTIRDAQTKEIALMGDWLSTWFGVSGHMGMMHS